MSVNNILFAVGIIAAGLLALLVSYGTVTGTGVPETKAQELATRISLSIDSLYGAESGSVAIEAGGKYDIEIAEKYGFLRSLGRAVLPKPLEDIIDREGYYVVVTPYITQAPVPFTNQPAQETRGERRASYILSYPKDVDMRKKLVGVDKACIVKRQAHLPEVEQC